MRFTRACLFAIGMGFASISAHASVFFDFVCDPDVTCGGDAAFGGFFEFSDAAVAGGSFTGVAGNILSFSFTTSSQGGLSWNLSSLTDLGPAPNPANLSIAFNGSRTLISDFDQPDSFTGDANVVSFGRLSFPDGNRLDVAVDFANDVNDNLVRGYWERRSVPEPGTLALLGLGLAGLAATRRRRQ